MASVQTVTQPSPKPTMSASTTSSPLSASSFIEYAKACGRCTPSLLPTDAELNEDESFYIFVSKLVDAGVQGVSLKNSVAVGREFQNAVKMTYSSTISCDNANEKGHMLIKRRAVLLLILKCTPGNNDALQQALNNALLVDIKAWLEDILSFKVGGVDLLLHLLSSICMLPVTKTMVTTSNLGKRVAAVEKHKICVSGMNQKAIKERVSKVKEEWSASVKRMKKNGVSSTTMKRSLGTNHEISPTKKKLKLEAGLKSSSLSNLIQQVSSSSASSKTSNNPITMTAVAAVARELSGKEEVDLSTATSSTERDGSKAIDKKSKGSKKRRIRWADSEGLPISLYHEAEWHQSMRAKNDKKLSTKDHKKRDRMKEKDLLQKARKIKLVDKDDSLDTMAIIFSSKWHQPSPLPPNPENSQIHVNSIETTAQSKRIASIMPVNFLSEEDVPPNPYPLTEPELTKDFYTQSTTTPQIIPFFFGQQPPTQTPVPVSLSNNTAVPIPPPPPILPPVSAAPTNATNALHTAAPIDLVRSMGLPDFLAGQNIQALQALVASPGLLNTFLDVNGNYDQLKIMNLIQAMNQQLEKSNLAMGNPIPPPTATMPPQQPPLQPPTFNHFTHSIQLSQYNSIPQASAYKPPTKSTTGNGYRADHSNTDGNLHLSGYNPATPIDSIVALFTPYVKVDEVVPKNSFMFLNTSDPEGAKRAREALNGVMIGGSPLRINVALRRTKTPMSSLATSQSIALLPRNALGQVDFDAVRDDRGNPATRNLFVAGYGQGTTEQQLRDVFSQHAQVTGVVMKSSFSFVNTTEKSAAVLARQALVGTNVNGGNLRINFAKESGRLGTNFEPSKSAAYSNNVTSYYGHNFQGQLKYTNN